MILEQRLTTPSFFDNKITLFINNLSFNYLAFKGETF